MVSFVLYLSGVKTVESDYPPELSTIWDEAKTNIELGDYDKAIEIYKYILIMYPDKKVAVEYANSYLGDIYLTLKNAKLAEGCIKKAIKLNPEKPAYRYQLGVFYSTQSLWKKAVREFKTALRKEPNNGEYLRGLGWAIYNESDKFKGLECLMQANKIEPNNINIMNDLSVAYLGIYDLKNATKSNKQVLKIDPGNFLARNISEQIKHLKKHWPMDIE
jgi:tetratricopeptide (TPR) repeat protein